MSLKIRLSRAGAKKRPFYRIVVADARMPRDGRFVEKIGTFDPLKAKDDATRLVLDQDKAKAWLAKGAQPTDRVLRLLDSLGLAKREPRLNPEKSKPKKKAQERAAAAQAAAAKAADAPRPEPLRKPDRLVLVGVFGAPQGVRGEIRVKSFTREPRAIGAYGALTDKGLTNVFVLERLRPLRDNMVVVKVKGVETRSAAAMLTGVEIFARRGQLPEPGEDEFYYDDLVGLEAVTRGGSDSARSPP